jgi:hypothetical protein
VPLRWLSKKQGNAAEGARTSALGASLCNN